MKMRYFKPSISIILLLVTVLSGCSSVESVLSSSDVQNLQVNQTIDLETVSTSLGADSSAHVELNKKKLNLKIGESFQLRAMGASAADVEWYTSNKKVASVTSQGVVNAKKKGTAKITAKVYGEKYTCKVTVTKAKEPNNNTQTYYNFRNPSYLTEHYKKHGIEMGYESEDAYLDGANAVINNPDALHKLEAEDDDHVYYIEATDEIVFLSQDGYIRTYFICSGRDYFDRQ